MGKALRVSNIVLRLGGGLAFALGAAGMLAWHIGLAPIVRWQPSWGSMPYNAALGLALLGGGLIAGSMGRRSTASVFGGVAAGLGLISLIEAVFQTNLRLDPILPIAALGGEMWAGPVAPGSGLGLACLGLAVVALTRSGRFGQRSPSAGLLSSVTAAVAMAALFGYVSGLTPAYAWGSRPPMTVQEIMGLTLLSAAVLAQSWQVRGSREPFVAWRWLHVFGGVGIVVGSVVLWRALLAYEGAALAQQMIVAAGEAQAAVVQGIEVRVAGLQRLAQHWPNTGSHPQDGEIRAALELSRFGDVSAVGWVGRGLELEWLLPPFAAGSARLNLTNEAALWGLVEATFTRGETAAARLADTRLGGDALVVFVPVVGPEGSVGAVVGVYPTQRLLRTLLAPSVAAGYTVRVTDSVGLVYDDPNAGRSGLEWERQAPVDLYGVEWRLAARPTPAVVAMILSALPGLVLTIGCILAALIAMLVLYLQRTWRLAETARNLEYELQQEVAIRRHAEEAAEEAEAHYRALTGLIDEWIWVVDQRGVFTHSSAAVEAILGYRPDELIGQERLNLLHEDDRERVKSLAPRWTADRHGWTDLVVRWRHKNGTYRYLESHGVPLLDRSNTLIGYRAAEQDVTGRVQTEKELELRARRQTVVAELGQRALSLESPGQVLAETVPLVVQTLDVEYCQILELDANGGALALRAGVGWWTEQPARPVSTNAETLKDEGGVRLLPPPPGDQGVVSGLSVMIRGMERPYGVLGVHTSRRRTFSTDETAFLQSIANILAVAIERQQAREEKTRLSESLNHAGRQLQRVVQSVPGMLWEAEIGADGITQVLRSVHHCEELLGYSTDEARAMLDFWLSIVHRDDQERVAREMVQVLSTGYGTYECRCVRRDGEEIWLAFTQHVTYDETTGQAVLMSGHAMDVTRSREAMQSEQVAVLLLRALARNVPNGSVVLFDQDLRFYLADGPALAAVGLAPDVVEGKTLAEVFPDEVVKAVEPRYRDALDGKIGEFEVPDGDRTYVVQAVPIADANKQIFGGMLLTQDITLLRRAEAVAQARQNVIELLARVAQSLAGAESRQALADCAVAIANRLDGATVGIWMLDTSDKMLALEACAGAVIASHGPLGRVALGEHYIGRIGWDGQPYLINELHASSDAGDPDWIRQQSLVAFAGVPLRTDEMTIGVLGLFARRPLDEDVVRTLERVGAPIAVMLARQIRETATAPEEPTAQSSLAAPTAEAGESTAPVAPKVYEDMRAGEAQHAPTAAPVALAAAAAPCNDAPAAPVAPARTPPIDRLALLAAMRPAPPRPHPLANGQRPTDNGVENEGADRATRIVLHIEDNPANLSLVQRLVAPRPGVQLLATMNGRLGLELAHEHRPDLILLDINLPDVPFLAVLEQLRANPETRSAPIVAMCNSDSSEQLAQLISAGVQAYLTKPLNAAKLLRLLDEFLGRGYAHMLGEEGDEPREA